MSSKEIYVSTDVEADGPIPGPNSMLSFGSAAYTGRKELIGTFSANLETLPGATADPKTAEWWAQQPEAWAACRQEMEMPETAIGRYVLWLKALPGKPVFVGYPAGFDFLFVYWLPDSLRRRKPLQLLRARYQNLRHGLAEEGLSQQHQTQHAQTLVRLACPYPRRPRRRH